MPHTYVIIFFVILFAAVLTMFVPLGQYETREITYMQNGEEKSRTVLDPDSFQYVTDENGSRITQAAPLFGTEDFGGQGILNYVFEGLTVGDKWGSAVGIVAFILVIGGAFGIVLRTGAVDQGILAMIERTKGDTDRFRCIVDESVQSGHRTGNRRGSGALRSGFSYCTLVFVYRNRRWIYHVLCGKNQERSDCFCSL